MALCVCLHGQCYNKSYHMYVIINLTFTGMDIDAAENYINT